MKTVKKVMMALVVLVTAGLTYSVAAAHNGATKDQVIDIYLNAVVHGKLTGIGDIIDDDVQFNMLRGNSVNTLNKQQMLDALKSSENVEQNCQCTKSVVQNMDGINTVKVEMKYADFTRTDVITAQQVGNGWKITKVDTSYQ